MTPKLCMLLCGLSPFVGLCCGVVCEAAGFGPLAPLYGIQGGTLLGLLFVVAVAVYQSLPNKEKK